MRRLQSCNLFEHWPSVRLVRGIGSTEGLCDTLSDSETGVYLLTWEEFSTFLAHAHWTGATLLEFLTETFDCPDEWTKAYRKQPIRLTSPTPSVLTATTAEWFWRHAKTEDFYGGFGNRFLFFTGARKPSLPNPRAVDGEAIQRIKERVRVITENPMQRAEWTTPARRLWEWFYVDIENSHKPDLLRAATKRAHVYVRKLAMTYAALEQTLPDILEEQLEAAITVIMFAVNCAECLLDQQTTNTRTLGEIEERLVRYVTDHPKIPVRRCQQRLWRFCDADIFNRVVRNLVEADRIVIVKDGDRRCLMSLDGE
jgi:hypothetical protein